MSERVDPNRAPDRGRIIHALAETARRWREPGYPAREEAVATTLGASESFTEEAVAFAVNQQMALITSTALERWASTATTGQARGIGALNAANVPFVELQDFLAVLLAGHAYVGSVSSRSPALLPAFARDLLELEPDLPIEFVPAAELFARCDAVIASGSDATAEWVNEQCEANGIEPKRRLIRGHRYSVAVTDGRESTDELERLAEDALLHEGFGCRNIAILWVPEGQSPDDILDAFARFRGVFPAHPSTPGRLRMQQAYLEAMNRPHGYGDGLEFLVSKGDPEAMSPGHIRLSEYESLSEVVSWLTDHGSEIQLVAVREGLHDAVEEAGVPTVALGEAQRPPLDWCPDGVDVMTFLAGID